MSYTYTDSTPSATVIESAPASDAGADDFDQGLAAFKAGEYEQSLTYFDAALQKQPNDLVIHEVRALALFAVGAYQPAAAALNAILAKSPGMDWTTVSGLYGNINDYTTQLRALEAYARANPKDAGAYFALAYQYLVTGSTDAAISTLQVVVQLQPKDVVAQQLLDSLQPPPADAATSAAPATAQPSPALPTPDAADGLETDLVGTWVANPEGTTITLTVTEDYKFTWKAEPKGQPPVEVSGDLTASDQTIVMSSKEQGDMAGVVTSAGPNEWKFLPSGAPATEPGLTFRRQP